MKRIGHLCAFIVACITFMILIVGCGQKSNDNDLNDVLVKESIIPSDEKSGSNATSQATLLPDETSVYSDAQLSEIADFTGTKDELISNHPTSYIETLPVLQNGSDIADAQDSYRVIYRGETTVLIFMFDASGNKVSAQLRDATLSKKSFDSLSIRQTLFDVESLDPKGGYLFLYTGRNDSSKVSNHYTTDGAIISITYDADNVITNIVADDM